MEALLDGKDKTDAYLQAAAHQQNQLSELNQGSVALQLETYKLVVKNARRCTGSAMLSSKAREGDMSHTHNPSSTNARRRQQAAVAWQKRKLQMNIQQQAAKQLPTVQAEQSGCQGQGQGQAGGRAGGQGQAGGQAGGQAEGQRQAEGSALW